MHKRGDSDGWPDDQFWRRFGVERIALAKQKQKKRKK